MPLHFKCDGNNRAAKGFARSELVLRRVVALQQEPSDERGQTAAEPIYFARSELVEEEDVSLSQLVYLCAGRRFAVSTCAAAAEASGSSLASEISFAPIRTKPSAGAPLVGVSLPVQVRVGAPQESAATTCQLDAKLKRRE